MMDVKIDTLLMERYTTFHRQLHKKILKKISSPGNTF